jgi:hypothetical protein
MSRYAASAGENVKTGDWAMKVKDWETTIQQIAYEFNHAPTEVAKDRVLISWRKKLEESSAALQPFQIDEIVREARNRLAAA